MISPHLCAFMLAARTDRTEKFNNKTILYLSEYLPQGFFIDRQIGRYVKGVMLYLENEIKGCRSIGKRHSATVTSKFLPLEH